MQSLDISNEKVLKLEISRNLDSFILSTESFVFGSELDLKVEELTTSSFNLWCKKVGALPDLNTLLFGGMEEDAGSLELEDNGLGKPLVREDFSAFDKAVVSAEQKFKETTGVFYSPYTYYMADYPFIVADFDGILRKGNGELGGIVVKEDYFEQVEWDKKGIPAAIRVELQQNMLVTGLSIFCVLANIMGKYKPYYVKADLELQKKLLDKLTEFWGYVEKKEPPTLAGLSTERYHLAFLEKAVSKGRIEGISLDTVNKLKAELCEKIGPPLRGVASYRAEENRNNGPFGGMWDPS